MSHGPLALPCPASCLSFSQVQVPMQFLISQSDVALWDKLPVFNFILNTCFSSKQFREASTKPNHYKMVINCGPNIQIMREREIEIERERERLWVERWGKEIELKEVYGYGCVGKEIYCISLPIPPIPFISFGSFLSPLLSHLCITLFVHQRYHLFILLSNDFISESSFHFPLPCLYSLYITLIENWKEKKIVNIFNYFFLFLIFFLKCFINKCLYFHLSAKSMKKWGKNVTIIDLCATTHKVNSFMYDRTHKVNWLKLWLWMHYWLRMKIRMTYLRS